MCRKFDTVDGTKSLAEAGISSGETLTLQVAKARSRRQCNNMRCAWCGGDNDASALSGAQRQWPAGRRKCMSCESTPGRIVVADGVVEIAPNAYKRENIRAALLPASVISIGRCAFQGCTHIVVLHLPATLQVIGDGAFYGCTGLVDLQLPATLQVIGDEAFYGCTGLVDLHLPATLQAIGASAFYGCTEIVDLQLPDALQAIGDEAFYGCTGIVHLQLPATLQSIGISAFRFCTGIAVLHLIDTLQTIGDAAFRGCTGIVNLQLPDSLQAIGDAVFRGCTGIMKLQLPDSLQAIGRSAFDGCRGITDLQLPASLQAIGNQAFLGCTGLTDLHLPATLQSIGEGDGFFRQGAFHGCSSLVRVLAPDSLVRGEMTNPTKAFAGCPVLATGLTPLSSVLLLRRTLWHPTMHSWCTRRQQVCVFAVLVAELRSASQRFVSRFSSPFCFVAVQNMRLLNLLNEICCLFSIYFCLSRLDRQAILFSSERAALPFLAHELW